MSNAELGDKMMVLFNEARWDEWQAELASDIRLCSKIKDGKLTLNTFYKSS